MYSLSANQNYREQRKIEKEELKKAKDLQKKIEKSKSSSFSNISKKIKSSNVAIDTLSEQRQHAVKRLDIRFSIYIRLLYSEPKTWLCKCITCENKPHWKQLDAWHFIDRSYYNYRWDEKNVHPQCTQCNRDLGWNIDLYENTLIHKYWELTVQQMKEDPYNPAHTKIPTSKIQELADLYQQLCMWLLRDKGLTLSPKILRLYS